MKAEQMITEAVFTSVQIFVSTPITYIYDLTMPGFTRKEGMSVLWPLTVKWP